MFNLDELACEDTATLKLRSPVNGSEITYKFLNDEGDEVLDKEGNPVLKNVTFTLLRQDGKVLQQLKDNHNKKRFNQTISKGKLKADYSDTTNHATALLRASIQSWSGMTLEGKDMVCNQINKNVLLTEPRFSWIRDQIESFISDDSNYLGNSPS